MIKKLLEEVTRIMKPHPVYLVGGAVRDYMMSNEPKDYDFCTPAIPDDIEKCIKSKSMRAYGVGKRFGTLGCKVKIDDKYHMVEITTFRSETYEPGNRKPQVEYVKTIQEDLGRRDFTINAMALRLTSTGNLRIIDPFNGQEDIAKKIIRCVGNSKIRFREDPLRILRAVRFATRYNFDYDLKTWDRMQKMAPKLLNISKERWMMEFDKILLDDNIKIGLSDLWLSNIFKYTIPELHLQNDYKQNSIYHNYNLDTHTIKVVEACPKDLDLRWAALLHDIAKPFVRTDKYKVENDIVITKTNYINHEILGAEMVDRIATHLKWSNARRETVVDLVRNHLKEDCILRKYDNMGK